MMFAVAGTTSEQIHARRERDVLDIGVETRRELVRDDGLARDGFEGQRADELAAPSAS